MNSGNRLDEKNLFDCLKCSKELMFITGNRSQYTFYVTKVCHQSDTNGAWMSRQLQEAAFPWKCV